MKKFLFTFILILSISVAAQHPENIFDQKQVSETQDQPTDAKSCCPSPPPAADDAPIDQHVALLFSVAFGIILYVSAERQWKKS